MCLVVIIMSVVKDKNIISTKFKVLDPDNSKLKCEFCLSDLDNEDTLGKKLTKNGLTVHYFCLLFASGLSQRGRKETEGLLGFLPKDITRELQRARRLKCVFCGHHSATIGCVVPKCRKTYHFKCGLNHDVLNQYFGNFRSYCEEHRPLQTLSPGNRLTFHGNTNTTCCICLSGVDAGPSISTIQAPCCKRAWFHKTCIQRTATNAGLHFFKCPLCCNKDQFQDEMLNLGIYIPDQDASWEREPNAFQELMHRHSRCDLRKCFCDKGRKYNKDESKWEIVLCDCCGSAGTHLYCSGLKRQSEDWVCAECNEITGVAEKEKKNVKKSKPPVNNNRRRSKNQTPSKQELSEDSRTPGCKRKSPESNSNVKRRRTEAMPIVPKIIFADTCLPKPSRAPLVRTRHSWNPDDAPESHYSIKKSNNESEDSAVFPSTSAVKLRPRRNSLAIKNVTVPVKPLPIGKLICMKLLQDRRKTIEILSLSSPKKSQNAVPSRDQPHATSVNRSLLSHYESTSSPCQEVSRGSEVSQSLEGPEAFVDQHGPNAINGTHDSQGNHNITSDLPGANYCSSTSVMDDCSPSISVSSGFSSSSTNDSAVNSSKTDVVSTSSQDSSSEELLSSTTSEPVYKNNYHSPAKTTPHKSTRQTKTGLQSSNVSATTLTAGTSESYEDFLASIKSCFDDRGEPPPSTQARSVLVGQDDVLITIPKRSAFKLSRSRSRSNTPVKQPQQSRSNTPVKIPNVSSEQNYSDFLASLKRKSRIKVARSEVTTSSCSKHADTHLTYEEFLASIGAQELDSEKIETYKTSSSSKLRRSRKQTLPKKRRYSSSLSTQSSPQKQSDVHHISVSSCENEDSDVGYIDCTDKPAFLVEDNQSSSPGYEQYKDCSSELFSDCSDDEIIISGSESGESPYLDCNGDNCVSEEVINLLNTDDMAEYTKHFSRECNDEEVEFSTTKITRYTVPRKCKV